MPMSPDSDGSACEACGLLSRPNIKPYVETYCFIYAYLPSTERGGHTSVGSGRRREGEGTSAPISS